MEAPIRAAARVAVRATNYNSLWRSGVESRRITIGAHVAEEPQCSRFPPAALILYCAYVL